MDAIDDTAISLPKLFSEGQEVQRKIESSQINSNSNEYMECVVRGVALLEEATRMVNKLSLFSRNEQLEEIATADLKYLLLPALLGDLTLQLLREERIDVLRRARVYLCDYLQRCKDYSITTEEVPSGVTEAAKQNFAQTRQTKIARQRLLKETNEKLKELDMRLSTGMLVDEGTQREQTVLLLQSWVYKCLDQIHVIDQELEILAHMEEMKNKPGQDNPKPAAVRKPPFKPILITREMIQSKVFGPGYPSLPSISLEEFHQQQAAQFQQQQAAAAAVRSGNHHGNSNDNSDDVQHKSSDEDDEEALQRARERDEFKDDHRRGEGNRKNKG